MAEPTPQEWPLSAAATAMLREGRGDRTEGLRLALKELVLRRAWRIDRLERSAFLRSRTEVRLSPGPGHPPDLAPLRELHAELAEAVGPDGRRLDHVVKDLRGFASGLPGALVKATGADLVSRGLVVEHRTRVLGLVPRTVLRPTPTGDALIADSWVREDAIREAVARDDATQIGAAGALVLLAHARFGDEIDEYFARRSTDDGTSAVFFGDPAGGGDPFSDVFHPSFDAAFDAGGGGGFGDGDGGGGGGD